MIIASMPGVDALLKSFFWIYTQHASLKFVSVFTITFVPIWIAGGLFLGLNQF